MKRILLIFVLFFACISSFPYNQLTVGDPRSSWYTYQGTIEQSNLIVKPKGVYMQYDLYLTFSSRGTVLTRSTDTLEVVLDFDLPEKAIVIDSWLWIGKDIIKAQIQDRWSASSIYESIVKRRKDPSILFKNSSTQYQLRIFPMVGNQTRKVKISYLIPAKINGNAAYSKLPIDLLKSSKNPVNLGVAMQKNNLFWSVPQILNNPGIIIKDTTDIYNGKYSKFHIQCSKYNNPIEIGYQRQLLGLMDFSYYKEGNDGYYQLAFFPSDFLINQQNRKLTVLVDYEVANTNLTTSAVLETLKRELKQNLTDKDSFNLMMSNMNIRSFSNKWTVATDDNIDQAFSDLSSALSTYSNLIQLINTGINFIRSNGNDGSVLLVSNSGQLGSNTSANSLINDISKMTNKKIPFYISDFQSVNNQYYYINNTYYYGNEYLYVNLARITAGSYYNMRDGLSESEVIDKSLINSLGIINSFDLYTKPNNGYCYSRYNISNSVTANYVDPVIQIGRFNGTLPFSIEFSGEYNSKIFTKSIQIDEVSSWQCDSVVKQIWSGLYINELESQAQTSNIINSILVGSLNDRVLSLYSAFLCLEDKSQLCAQCVDESGLTALKMADKEETVKVYPNPFSDQLNIEIEIDKNDVSSQLCIYNLTGSLIYKFDVSSFNNGKNSIVWNGLDIQHNPVPAGVYILSFRSNARSYNVRILKN